MIANKENWQPDCRGQICNSSICFVGVHLADDCSLVSYDFCEILTHLCILFLQITTEVPQLEFPLLISLFQVWSWKLKNKHSRKTQSSRGEANLADTFTWDVDVIYQNWSCFYFIIVNDVCLKFHHAQARIILMLFSVSAVLLHKETCVVMFHAFVWLPPFLVINLH